MYMYYSYYSECAAFPTIPIRPDGSLRTKTLGVRRQGRPRYHTRQYISSNYLYFVYRRVTNGCVRAQVFRGKFISHNVTFYIGPSASIATNFAECIVRVETNTIPLTTGDAAGIRSGACGKVASQWWLCRLPVAE